MGWASVRRNAKPCCVAPCPAPSPRPESLHSCTHLVRAKWPLCAIRIVVSQRYINQSTRQMAEKQAKWAECALGQVRQGGLQSQTLRRCPKGREGATWRSGVGIPVRGQRQCEGLRLDACIAHWRKSRGLCGRERNGETRSEPGSCRACEPLQEVAFYRELAEGLQSAAM